MRSKRLENVTLSAVTILTGLSPSPWDPPSFSPVAFSFYLFSTSSPVPRFLSRSYLCVV